jgi:small conductance mechanosensitive channel
MEEMVQQVDLSLLEQGIELVVAYTPRVIGGIVILVIGWMIASWLARMTRRALGRVERIDLTLRNFFVSLVRYVVLILTGLAVLSQFGVQTASLIAVFGAAGLAIGLAMQGTLSNLAAGVMLLLFRPFKVGDYIEGGGTAGSVKELTLFTTELATPDNVQIIVPNGTLWGSIIKNYSFHATRRVDFALGIGYGDDIGQAMEAVKGVIEGEPRVHAEPEPQVVVGELGDSSVGLIVRVWCQAEDYWDLKFDLTRRFKETFDARGISIPFPQRDVHVHQIKAA